MERLKNAFKNNKVEFWENRPQNLSRNDLERVIGGNPSVSDLKMMERKSSGGEHGLDGEDNVYSAKLLVENYGIVKAFYIKCFFWRKIDKREAQGVEVQSFKSWEQKEDVQPPKNKKNK